MKRLAAVVALALALAGTTAAAIGDTISTVASVPHPRSLALLPDGSFLVAEPFVNLVQQVWPDGRTATVAGTGTAGFSGDGGPATAADLNFVHDAVVIPGGGFLIADADNFRIRRVDASGTITTVAGNGDRGSVGDGGLATSAELDTPRGVAALPDGSFLIADSTNNRIRLVSPDGTITTVAGTGTLGFSGDGGPATQAQLNLPFAAVPLSGGGLLIADTANDRIRRVALDGTITTVAGNGTEGFAGDGGPATAAELNEPHAVIPLPDGGFLIADTHNNRVRRVSAHGTITTVAGDGTAAFAGDGGPAVQAELNQPKALAVRPDELGFYVADALNDRVRFVALDLRPPFIAHFGAAPHARSGRIFRVAYTLSEPATVRLEFRRHFRLVLALRIKGRAGSNVVTVRALPHGRYGLRLSATTSDGRVASASGPLDVLG